MVTKPAKLAALAAALITAGCTLGPEYHRPDLAVPPGWSTAAADAARQSASSRPLDTPASVDAWWTVFRDPILDKLIETAAIQNLDVQQATLRIAEARAERDVTAAGLFPKVNGSGIAGRARMSQNGISQALSGGQAGAASGAAAAGGGAAGASQQPPPSTFNLFQAGFDATWELDLFGKVRRGIQAADADIRGAEAARNDSLLSLNAEIARTYFSLRAAQVQYDIALQDIATQEHLARLVESRRRSGLAASSDVAAQQVQVAAAHAGVPPTEQAIAQSLNRLALLLAQPPGAVTGVVGHSPLPALPSEVPIGLPGDLLRRRPDVREREASLQAATARIGVAKAQLFPSVTLGMTAGLQSTTTAKLLDWSSRFAIGGADLSVPIFSGGKLRAQVRVADLQAQEAVLAYREAVLAAFHDADNALLGFAADQRRELDVRRQFEGAERTRDLTLARYRSGLAAFIDVLNAEHQAHQAAIELADASMASSTGLVALFKALGGGWPSETVAMR
jgi:NodT family efflux transporter outer membrane factor (OMF) lipoprotein